jgi:bis(5'-nucleosyl)-tetraphosphatase (symmetrical)
MQKIFVGDVQGCARELRALVTRAERCFGARFSLWLVGDLVNRGPDNRAVLELVHDLSERGRAHVVAGNHELLLLRRWFGQRAADPADTLDDVLDHPDARAWVEWVRRLPLALSGEIGQSRFVLVHASVHPDWSVEETLSAAGGAEERLGGSDASRASALLAADPAKDADREVLGRLLNARSIAPDGRARAEEPAGASRAWHEVWSERRHPHGIVYGHWSLQGLHVARGLRGLDTGCVHHGRGRDGFLTAWLPDERTPAFGGTDMRFWQVRAERPYFGGVSRRATRELRSRGRY